MYDSKTTTLPIQIKRQLADGARHLRQWYDHLLNGKAEKWLGHGTYEADLFWKENSWWLLNFMNCLSTQVNEGEKRKLKDVSVDQEMHHLFVLFWWFARDVTAGLKTPSTPTPCTWELKQATWEASPKVQNSPAFSCSPFWKVPRVLKPESPSQWTAINPKQVMQQTTNLLSNNVEKRRENLTLRFIWASQAMLKRNCTQLLS